MKRLFLPMRGNRGLTPGRYPGYMLFGITAEERNDWALGISHLVAVASRKWTRFVRLNSRCIGIPPKKDELVERNKAYDSNH